MNVDSISISAQKTKFISLTTRNRNEDLLQTVQLKSDQLIKSNQLERSAFQQIRQPEIATGGDSAYCQKTRRSVQNQPKKHDRIESNDFQQNRQFIYDYFRKMKQNIIRSNDRQQTKKQKIAYLHSNDRRKLKKIIQKKQFEIDLIDHKRFTKSNLHSSAFSKYDCRERSPRPSFSSKIPFQFVRQNIKQRM